VKPDEQGTENVIRSIGVSGESHQNTRVGYGDTFCEAEPTLLLLFWKRRKQLDESVSFGCGKAFCEAEPTLLLLFWKRRLPLGQFFMAWSTHSSFQ
jgi:hypothetical protein